MWKKIETDRLIGGLKLVCAKLALCDICNGCKNTLSKYSLSTAMVRSIRKTRLAQQYTIIIQHVIAMHATLSRVIQTGLL